MRVTVDADICGGHGACLAAAPDVFVLTDDGWAEVVVDEVPAGMEAAVEQAALHCPTKAIVITSA